MGEIVSTYIEIFSGVTQGSVIFFAIVITDQFECECELYADDSELISLA
jgi:hypothetical protein